MASHGEAPTEVTEREEQPAERIGLIHAGDRYAYGFGRNFYGIWDEMSPENPVERFPASAQGRVEAWNRYLELEPSAAESDAAASFAGEEALDGPRSRRRFWVIVGATLLVLIVGGVLLSRGGGGGDEGIPAPQKGTTHIDAAGGASEDLQQQDMVVAGLESLYPVVKGTWTGATATLTIELNSPDVGANPTVFNPPKSLTLVVENDKGKEITYKSIQGECTITVSGLSDAGVSGSFECTDMPSQTTDDTIDVTGKFFGTATS